MQLTPDLLSKLTPAEYEHLTHLVTRKRILDAREGDLTAFCQLVYPHYYVDPFHQQIHEYLTAVMRRDINRLIVSAPPQTGKSTDISSIFPAFWVGQFPDDPMLLISYAQDKATEYSDAARNIVESDIYSLIFPKIKTRMDSRAKHRWNVLNHAGRMYAAGFSGQITGRGAKLALIDDPLKGWEDAMSQNFKDKQWQDWKTVIRPRVWEGGAIIIIMTRWAEDDLAGRLLNSSGAADWTLLRYTALAETQQERDQNNQRLHLPAGLPDPLGREPGERLTRYSQAYWEQLRRDVGGAESLEWAGLYLGVPRPYEGQWIKRSWFIDKIVEQVEVPPGGEHIRYWDKAGTEDGGARTAGVLMTKVGDDYYIEDVICGQWSPYERNKIIKDTAKLDAGRYVVPDPRNPRRPISELEGWNEVTIWVEQEPGSGGKESADISITDLSGFPVQSDPPHTNKDARLMPFATQLQAGHVYLVQANWNETYIDELTAVPKGIFRDIADASAGAFNKVETGGISFGAVTMGGGDPYADW